MKLLFIPVSSKKGIGEYMRSLIIANAVKARWPDAEIAFVLSRQAPYHQDCPYPTFLTEQTPTRHVKEVNAVISEFKPQAVVFDASGRKAQLRHARACGALTIFISQHAKKRARGLRFDRLLQTDLHWVSQPEFVIGKLGAWSRFKLNLLNKPAPLYLGTLYNAPSELEQEQVLNKHGLQAGQYVFFSAGSGGHFCGDFGRAADCFEKLAATAADQGFQVVQVFGANYPAELPEPPKGCVYLKSLPNHEFIALLGGSAAAVLSGGGTLLQALSLQVPALAIPVSGDQPARVAACKKAGVIMDAAAEPESMLAALERFLEPATRAELKARMQALGLQNGVDLALDSLEKELKQRSAGT